MVSPNKVMESFHAKVTELLPELKKINDLDCDDRTKGEKMFRKIQYWFKTGGTVNKMK